MEEKAGPRGLWNLKLSRAVGQGPRGCLPEPFRTHTRVRLWAPGSNAEAERKGTCSRDSRAWSPRDSEGQWEQTVGKAGGSSTIHRARAHHHREGWSGTLEDQRNMDYEAGLAEEGTGSGVPPGSFPVQVLLQRHILK